MTADDIIRVAITVSVAQVVVDLMARQFVYKRDPYQKAVSALERAQTKYSKLEKETASKTPGKQQEKVQKRLNVAKDDLGAARGDVAKRHSGPGILSGFLFMILFRILGAEHYGKVMGVLPFTPFRLLQKLTLRGLDFGDDLAITAFHESKGVDTVQQACSFAIIYLLCNVGVKFYVHKLVGEAAPSGAEGGIMAVMDDPKVARGLKQMGLDPDDLKMD